MRKSNKRKLEIAALQNRLSKNNELIASLQKTVSVGDGLVLKAQQEINRLKDELTALPMKDMKEVAPQ